ncbi:DUF3105 domain-containing protein [Deinococcus arcticus]|uniref:DUF3105 domain-containing protein n=1 Tax=Deinococcus arcticus TaxID=2136176 RepID=A0A2T3W4G2_9DEIO|nr:DUF3105 domain-containing protein [Deinococcus arcticus]PTA66759.1 hypothetical protein C8263_16130 [Deinococcus arcticus]
MKRMLLLTTSVLLASCANRGGDIDGVQSFQHEGGDHQEGRIAYAARPPAGGAHHPTWQNCGVYDQPIYDEYAVHSLEHGAVWVSYQRNLPAAQLETLKQLVDGRTSTLLSPHDAQTAPVIITAWNKQLAVQDAADQRLKRFLEMYEQSKEAPERGASCSGAYSGTV